MSLLTQAYLLEKYGPRLGADDVAKVLGISRAALYNQISAGTCRVKTYLDGGKRWADYRDVAAFFDEVRAAALGDDGAFLVG